MPQVLEEDSSGDAPLLQIRGSSLASKAFNDLPVALSVSANLFDTPTRGGLSRKKYSSHCTATFLYKPFTKNKMDPIT